MQTGHHFAANLDNLTALWRALGADGRALPSGALRHRSASWPERLWCDVGVALSGEDRAALAAEAAASGLVVPVWRRDGERAAEADALTAALTAGGLEHGTTTVVMDAALDALDPSRVSAPALELDDGKEHVTLWADVAARSFGYAVDPAAVARLRDRDDAHLVVARRGGAPVGTGLLFVTGEVAGLHMLGVPPEARRQGVAGGVMLQLLAEARWRGLHHAALQASAMGQGLYERLGFARSGAVDWFRGATSAS